MTAQTFRPVVSSSHQMAPQISTLKIEMDKLEGNGFRKQYRDLIRAVVLGKGPDICPAGQRLRPTARAGTAHMKMATSKGGHVRNPKVMSPATVTRRRLYQQPVCPNGCLSQC